jgi:hypothetical protein
MKYLSATAMVSSIGLTVGNFLWQAVTSYEWGVAAERSFFQFAAIVTFAGMLYFNNRTPSPTGK